ncbi:MAG: phosphatase PAP2 family protein [Burkholderiales bacterium]
MQFLRKLRARIRTLWVLKTLGTAGGIAAFFWAYFWVMRHPLGDVAVMPVVGLDRLIGFHPGSFPLYASLWVYISLGSALARNLRELAAFGAASLGMSVLGLAIFMLLPTRVPVTAIDWALYPSLQFLKTVDVTGNACPSLHAAFCVFTAGVLYRELGSLAAPAWLRWTNLVWCLGILFSTVATRQHVALDAIAGIALGLATAMTYQRALRSAAAA